MIKIRKQNDFYAGLFFIAFGLVTIWVARGYPMGTTMRMGAGYFPIMVGGLLTVIGLIITATALAGKKESFPRLAWRPLIVITISLVLFGLLVKPLGLILAIIITVLVSRLSETPFRWFESLALGSFLAFVSAALFVYGLGLLLPLWPRLGG